MKPFKNLATLILLLSISIILFSCGNNLSRGKAEDLIIQKYSLPQYETTKLKKIYIKSYYGSGYIACLVSGERYVDAKSLLDELVAKGMITVTENGPIGECNIVQALVNLTNDGKKYLVNEFKDEYVLKTCEVVFGEITGIRIQEQLKIAEANYTLNRINCTPFAIEDPILPGTGRTIDPTDKSARYRRVPYNRTASFSLFDDGWRIN